MTHMPISAVFALHAPEALRRACRMIPPAWPLNATVAVNPFLGHARETLPEVAARMERIGGPRVSMPGSWYRAKLDAGAILDRDIEVALEGLGLSERFDVPTIRQLLTAEPEARAPLPKVADLIALSGRHDLKNLARDRISFWAQSWFDQGQAMWAPSRASGAFASWREFAMNDLVPELSGLPGFCRTVANTASSPVASAIDGLVALGFDPNGDEAESYCHQLLIGLGGWAQAARLPGWQAERAGEEDETLLALLAASLVFEATLLASATEAVRAEWAEVVSRHGQPLEPSGRLLAECVAQVASEEATRRELFAGLHLQGSSASLPVSASRPDAKAFFCIDVRSEVFRRALESVAPQIETGGFAGFFGMGASHHRFGSGVAEHRLPVLLAPRICTEAGGPETGQAQTSKRIADRAKRALGRFSNAAVASFAYVEAAGLGYAAGLAKSAAGWTAGDQADRQPVILGALSVREKASMAAGILRAMSLTVDFPKIVLLVGHGAQVENNPFQSALHCGACGGHAGDANARLLASLLNDMETRKGLGELGIYIPETTMFVAGLHDTTSDEVTLFEDDLPYPATREVADLRIQLAQAGLLARAERALRLPGATTQADVQRRGSDWSELRPEWGLAGCSAFIAAPRSATRGKTLEGRAFLHDYDWRSDEGFGVLELILTAPVVVASWISLQYYGSAVSPAAYGSGNKLLHNVVGGMGVLEGNAGPLRTGLPWQSVHDGGKLVHEPVRLTVLVAAPEDAVTQILVKHPDVACLFDKGWLSLVRLDDEGRPAARYTGERTWSPLNAQ